MRWNLIEVTCKLGPAKVSFIESFGGVLSDLFPWTSCPGSWSGSKFYWLSTSSDTDTDERRKDMVHEQSKCSLRFLTHYLLNLGRRLTNDPPHSTATLSLDRYVIIPDTETENQRLS